MRATCSKCAKPIEIKDDEKSRPLRYCPTCLAREVDKYVEALVALIRDGYVTVMP